MVRTVRIFSVTRSPVLPSPRVAACFNTPPAYRRLTAKPSNLGSAKYVTSSSPIFSESLVLRSNCFISDASMALLSERIGER